MKVLKTIFLVIIALCMAGLLVVIQLQNMLQSTVLSSKYFNDMYDMSEMDEVLDIVVTDAIADFSVNQSIEGITINLENAIDPEVVSVIAEDTIKGSFAYIVGDEEKLPEIDIKPVKDMVLDVITKEVKSFSDSMSVMYDIIIDGYDQLAQTEEGEIDYEAIGEITKISGGIASEEMVEQVVLAAEEVDDNASVEERNEAITRNLMSSLLSLDEIADGLDLDSFVSSIFGEDNPTEAIRDIIVIFKQKLFITLLICLGLYMVVVILTAFKPGMFFGWLAGVFLAGGLFGFSVGLIGMITPVFTRYMTTVSPQITSNIDEYILALMQNLSSSISVFFFIQGLIILVIGIAFLILSIAFTKAAKRNGTTEIKKNPPITVLRIVFVIAALVAIIAVSANYGLEATLVMDNAITVLENSSSALDTNDVISKLTQELGLPDFPIGK